MEVEEKSSLFSLSIDDTTQSHLLSIAKWHKFIAITGMVGCSFWILALIISDYILYNPAAYYSDTIVIFIISTLISVLFFIPCIFQLRFANKMVKALAGNDQFLINESLKQLKIFSRYWGVVMIIAIGVIVFSLLITLIN